MHYGVIIAGGRGLRLWPLSRLDQPKQLLEVIGGVSLLRLSYDRLAMVLPAERILVCTAERDVAAVHAQLPELPAGNVLGEPVGRDTVNAIGLSCAVLAQRDPDAVVAVVTADHVIEPVAVFAAALEAAYGLADRPDRLVTFGVVPTSAHTGYGYLEYDADSPVAGSDPAAPAYPVSAFVEKPAAERAAAYVSSGRFLWNSGMFVWRADTLLSQLAQRLPVSAEALRRIAPWWNEPPTTPARTASTAPDVAETYQGLTATSIDYAVMEPAAADPVVEVVVMPLRLEWIDVGSWLSLGRVLPRDAEGNEVLGQAVMVDSAGNIVVSDDPERLVATLGLRDTVVVQTADVTLVCPRAEADRLKDLVAEVERRTGSQFA